MTSTLTRIRNLSLSCLFIFSLCLPAVGQQTSGLTSDIISSHSESVGDFPIVNQDQKAAPLRYDPNDYEGDRKSARLNSSHVSISYAVFCLKKKNKTAEIRKTR